MFQIFVSIKNEIPLSRKEYDEVPMYIPNRMFSKTIPTTKVRQYSHIMADATPVMYKSFEKLLLNNFQVIIFERMAKNCFKVNILSKICQNICFSIKKVLIFHFLYMHELDHLMIITIYYHYLNF